MTWIRPLAAHGPRPCTLVVCRGCCCGTPRKHPGTDHAAQLDRLREAADASGGRLAVRTVDCLGPCEQANVIVVQPSTEARRRGARAAWFGFVLDGTATEDVIDWALSGGPGTTPLPEALELHRVDPPSDKPTPTRRDRPRSTRRNRD
ncbi:(2Fe-2S) ferredoxin domain-containing protein [Streptomyces sp. NPDC012888]|uniref:(2Fe-2S) ferredoxin domain-containing protein n=1 Tax=Streptomyces sp. NPDC012888 TaxID=3364855 RepID=UPI0036AD3959